MKKKRKKERNDLTLTGLLMEGLSLPNDRLVPASGRRSLPTTPFLANFRIADHSGVICRGAIEMPSVGFLRIARYMAGHIRMEH